MNYPPITVRFVALAAIILTSVSCSRDPKRFVESGNKYFERGNFKAAAILYRSATKADPKFGEGYYHLALAELKLEQYQNSVGPLRRAIELLPQDSPDWLDSNIQYAEVILAAAPGSKPVDQAAIVEEVRGIKDVVLRRNPNAFEGQRLSAELMLMDAQILRDKGKTEEAGQKTEKAIGIYQHALALKPGDTKLMMSLGKTQLVAGRTDDAEQTYRQIIANDKTLPGPYLDLYRLYISKQRLADAEAILKRAIALRPADSTLQYQLALFYFSTQNRAEMTKVLDNLRAHYKQDPDTFLKLGDFYVRIGNSEEAVRAYQEGASLDSARRLVYQKCVIAALIRKGMTVEAYQKVEQFLKDDPKDAAIKTTKANYLVSKGDLGPAIDEFQAVVNATPNNFVARTGLGRAYLLKKDLPQAAHQLEAAVAINSGYVPALVSLGQIALMQRNFDKALTMAKSALKINPTDGAAQLIEATAYLYKGQFDEARPRLDLLVKVNPNRADPLAELAVLNLLEKHYKEAEDLFRKAYDAEPTNVRGILGVAQVRLQNKNPEGAIRAIADEVAKHPERGDLKRELADIELQIGRYDKAIEDYKAVVGQFNGNSVEQAEIYGRIGQAAGLKGDFQLGVDNYRKARQLAPTNVFYVSRIGELLAQAGKRDEAVGVYREALNIEPNNPRVLNGLAYAMSESGKNLDEALTLAQRAKQQVSNFNDASDTIGWIYFRRGLNENAAEIFKDLTAKAQDNAIYHYHYGMVLANKGDKINALKEFKAALKSNPSKTDEAEIKDQIQKIS